MSKEKLSSGNKKIEAAESLYYLFDTFFIVFSYV